METLPPQKFQPRPYRFTRKRRRSGAEATESEGMFPKEVTALTFCLLFSIKRT